jgi:hypothetical protein
MILAAVIAQSDTIALRPVEDTSLDRATPEVNYGRDTILKAGEGRVVLVRFPQLGFHAGGLRRAESAAVQFRIVADGGLELKSVSRMLKPWREGAGRSTVMGAANAPTGPGLGASWSGRGWLGQTGWSSPGASGSGDAEPVPGAKAVVDGETMVVTGLQSAIDRMAADPDGNFGFRFEFAGAGSFASSDLFGMEPRLDVKWADAQASVARLAATWPVPQSFPSDGWPAPGTPVTWTAKVRNLGGAASGYRATWTLDDRALGEPVVAAGIGPGEAATLSVQVPQPARGDFGSGVLRLRVEPTTAGASGGTAAVSVFAVPIHIEGASDELAVAACRIANDGLFGQSRSTLAQEGVAARFRPAPADQAMVVVKAGTGADPFASALAAVQAWNPLSGQNWASPPSEAGLWLARPGGMGLGIQTLDDWLWLKALPLPAPFWMEKRDDQPILPDRALLGVADALAIALRSASGQPGSWSAATLPQPRAIALELLDLGGQPVGEAEVRLSRPNGELLHVGKTNRSGVMILGGKEESGPFGRIAADGSNAWLLVEASRGGQSAKSWVPVWRASVEGVRGGGGLVFLQVGLAIGTGPISAAQDLALGRTPTDSAGRFPAQLTAAVDADLGTSVPVGPDSWIEVDLGRDRLLGQLEIAFDGPVPERFDVLVGKTGQGAGSGTVWLAERFGGPKSQALGRDEGGRRVVTYPMPATLGRYVRLRTRDQAAGIAALRVRPLATPN